MSALEPLKRNFRRFLDARGAGTSRLWSGRSAYWRAIFRGGDLAAVSFFKEFRSCLTWSLLRGLAVSACSTNQLLKHDDVDEPNPANVVVTT